jgi:hypothetical protein
MYESGRTTFWNLVEKDFSDSNWKIRMQAGLQTFILIKTGTIYLSFINFQSIKMYRHCSKFKRKTS